jgi:hypothetical protein
MEKEAFREAGQTESYAGYTLQASLLPNSSPAKHMTQNLFSLTRRVLLTSPRKSVNCDFLRWQR